LSYCHLSHEHDAIRCMMGEPGTYRLALVISLIGAPAAVFAQSGGGGGTAGGAGTSCAAGSPNAGAAGARSSAASGVPHGPPMRRSSTTAAAISAVRAMPQGCHPRRLPTTTTSAATRPRRAAAQQAVDPRVVGRRKGPTHLRPTDSWHEDGSPAPVVFAMVPPPRGRARKENAMDQGSDAKIDEEDRKTDRMVKRI
jgi:hypothetical protein